ncbi:hypothetical protein [Caballeronia glebae]|uniref:hypothetical protein n=1 Tax=Caballeronia glebae TaxID=1777143 RepID=UPI00117FE45B|nr:hypothetical protein [Caballeronia glebae]
MSTKSTAHKKVRPSISPLLGSLMQAAKAGSSNPLLLRSLVALDALHRGKGTTALLTLLAQQLLISEELCLSGYQSARLGAVQDAHAALVRLDREVALNGDWKAAGAQYEALRKAFVVYDAQLRSAPRTRVHDAQLTTTGRLLDHLVRREQATNVEGGVCRDGNAS